MTIVSAIFLAGIVAVVAGSIAFTVIGYEALIAYGAPPARSAFSDVRAVDDGSLIAYVEHRRRWRWWFKLCDPVACMIEPGWILPKGSVAVSSEVTAKATRSGGSPVDYR
jgi:hypothetical protein